MNKAFAYARKSSESEDRQTRSIEDQLTEIQRLQHLHNIPIITTFSENKSAKIPGQRAQFDNMIQRIKNGDADTIYVAVLNRLSRNGVEAGILINLLDTGILKQIITPSSTYDRNINSEMLWIEFMGSTKFSKDLSKIVKERLLLKAQRGDMSGHAPLGYANTPKRLKGQRIIIPDKKRWDLCRTWWNYMLTGIYTVEQTLDLITADGLTGKKGKAVSRTKAYAFFRDIFYTGSFIQSGITYPGNHTPMVAMSEWLKVQQLLDSKGKKGPHTLDMPEEKTFQGMLKCGECGATITMEHHIRKYKNGNSQTFWYYRCTKKLGPCSQPCLNATLFLPQVRNYISSLKLNPEYTPLIKRTLKRINAQEFGLERKQQELKTRRLIDITDRKENLYGMKIDGLFSEDEYQKRKKEILIEEVQLRESYAEPRTKYWESVIDDAVSFAEGITQLFEYGDIFTRQMVLRTLGSNLILKDKKVKIQAKNAFIFLKGIENDMDRNSLWLEPEIMSNLPTKKDSFVKESSSVRGTGVEPAHLSIHVP